MLGKRTLLQNVFLALALGVVLFFCLFPFIQILSTSLKHQFDWGNPSLIPIKFNLKAYQELLGLGETGEAPIPETVKRLLDNPSLTKAAREKILKRYQSTRDVFPFPRFFLNTFLLSVTAAGVSLFLAVFGVDVHRVEFHRVIAYEYSVNFAAEGFGHSGHDLVELLAHQDSSAILLGGCFKPLAHIDIG